MPKISIVVSAYNSEKYISKCIESILNQTFKDFELLIINDGSTDNTFLISQKYEVMDNRIRVFDRQRNYGVSSSRNYGIKKSLYNYFSADNSTSLSKKYYSNLYDLQKLTYEYRKEFISEEYNQIFIKEYFFKFIQCLENTFDKQNSESLLKKLKYNKYIVDDTSFVEVLNRIKPEKYDEKLVEKLKNGNILPVYLSMLKRKMVHH